MAIRTVSSTQCW